MSHPNHRPAVSSARRRLLRGSFAAPAVLVVGSGSALAASSSLQCLAKQPTSTDPAANLGTWYGVARYTLTKPDDTTVKVVQASEVASVVGGLGPGFSAASFVAGKTWIDVQTGADQVPKTSTTPTPDNGVRVALRFTNYGVAPAIDVQVTGLSYTAGLTGDGKLLSSSCWTSAKP